ncbi:MAG: Uma2 family endonuclease [Syntrophobacteraceae bacterium]
MSERTKKKASYEDLYSVPENMTGEIIGGELIVTPGPSRRHVYATTALGNEVGPPYQLGRGGPGGWVILIEPEIGLGEHIIVPDLAGWRGERYPDDEPHNWISVAPDWVCEMLSPGTRRLDRMVKMPIYAQHEVPYLWLIDPMDQTLEVYRLKESEWVVAGLHKEADKVRAVPFSEIEINLTNLWQEYRCRRSGEVPGK